MSEKFQLHATDLKTLGECGIRFERRRLRGEKIPPPVAVVIGTATHRSIARNLQMKLDSGAPLPREVATDAARDAVEQEWAAGVTLDGEFGEVSPENAKGAAIDMAVALSALHYASVAPHVNPIHVERPWVLDIAGLDIQFAGTIDIQEEDAIRDTKTSGKPPSPRAVDESMQLTAYALAVEAHDGKIPATVGLDYLVKAKTPRVVRLEGARTRADFPMLLARVERAARVIESGIFQPASPDWWGCSERFCGYWSTCPFAARPVTVAVNVEVGDE